MHLHRQDFLPTYYWGCLQQPLENKYVYVLGLSVLQQNCLLVPCKYTVRYSQQCTPPQVKDAFRKLCLLHHPGGA
jgi:hypothetical protein